MNNISTFIEFVNEGRKPMGYWTKEKCHKEALKYNTRGEFNEKSKGAYLFAYRNNWLDDICSHMKSPKKSNILREDI